MFKCRYRKKLNAQQNTHYVLPDKCLCSDLTFGYSSTFISMAHLLRHWFGLLALALFFTNKVAIAQNEHLVAQYKKKYPQAHAVILNAEVTYTFALSKKKKLPYIKEDRKETYLALGGHQKLRRFAFYDQHSEIKQAKRFGNYNKSTKQQEIICGNYNSDGIFYSDAQVCQYPFVLGPKGSTQGLSYVKKYNDPRYFTTIFFNDALPVVAQTIVFNIPDWMNIELKPFNFSGFDIQQKQVKKANGHTQYIFMAQQLPPIEKYDYVPGNTHTYPHLLVLSKSFTLQGNTQPILGSINDLYQWYQQVAGGVQNNLDLLKPLVNKLTQDKTSQEEKVKAIFYWVQDNIRYIAFEDGIAAFKPEAAQKVYQNKYGDCKGMANLTKTMLKLAGFDARLTWIGTKHIAYDYTLPSIAVANHMICTLLLNNKKYYLDATEKYVPFGKYAERIQGRPILIEDGQKYLLEKIPLANKEQNQVIRQQSFVIKGETLVGSGKHTYQGEQKKEILYYLNHTAKKNTKDLVKLLVDLNDKNCQIDSLQFSNMSIREGEFTITYQMALNNKVAGFDSEMYIDLDFYQEFKDLETEKDRLSNLNLREKILRKTRIELQIPTGYQVKHLPKNLSQVHQEFQVVVHFKSAGNKIIYTKELSVENGTIKKASFQAWNTAIDALKKVYNDQIILEKTK